MTDTQHENEQHLELVDAEELDVLFCQQPPQPAVIDLDLRRATLRAHTDPPAINGIPVDVWNGTTRRWTLHAVSADAINRTLREIAPLAKRVLADCTTEFDGSNTVPQFGPRADAALAAIDKYFDSDPFDEDEYIACWAPTDLTAEGDVINQLGITVHTSDEQLEAHARALVEDIRANTDSHVSVCPGLFGHLVNVRDALGAA